MKFLETKLKGSFNIEIEPIEDDGGFFARAWDKNIFEKNGLNINMSQCNISRSKKRGTTRGMHYQKYPFQETKIVRCTKGKLFNVIIDLRADSKTYLKWDSIELSEENHISRYIPKGFANGIQILEDNSEIFYQMSEFYTPNAEQGIRWDDPFFKIKWPLEPTIISEKDKNWKLFQQ